MKLSGIMEKITPLLIGETVKAAVDRMVDKEVDFLPVVNGNEVFLGIVRFKTLITELNIIRSSLEGLIETDIPVYPPEMQVDCLDDAVQQVVVIDSDRRVLGIVTASRLAMYLQKSLKKSRANWQSLFSAASTESVYKEIRYFKQLNAELMAIINSSYDGFFITDGEGRVLKLNKAYERITGIKGRDVVGKTMSELVEQGIYDQSVTTLVMDNLKSTTLCQQIKATSKQVLVTGNPVFDENGKLMRVVTNVRDVTELNQLQSEIKENKEQKLKYEAELSLLRSRAMKHAEIVYASKSMGQIIELASRVAHVNSNVLITGESGTGKELIARLIHKTGKGAKAPFIKINCGAIPEQLLESELFGYEGGAFTGAKKEGKPGMFELAHTGTLFLDEIGELPPFLQVKLLRAIQEKEILRVGGTKPIKVDVRIVTATHRNLFAMVKAGEFREDLYYRLMVVPIQLPPLRERREDIPHLVRTFLDNFNTKFGYQKTISHAVLNKLLEYSWPGNIRELQNVMERMMVVSKDNELTVDLLPTNINQKSVYMPRRSQKLRDALAETEAHILKEAYSRLGCWQKVANELGVDRTTIFRKVAKYKLNQGK